MDINSIVTYVTAAYLSIFTLTYFTLAYLYRRKNKHGYLGLILITMIANMGSYAYFLNYVIKQYNSLQLNPIYFEFFMDRGIIFLTNSELILLVFPSIFGILFGFEAAFEKSKKMYSL